MKLGNASTAVMARRASPPDALDFFPTPPWATRALCEQIGTAEDLGAATAWDPACGEGHMVRPLAEYFAAVHGSDIHDYGAGFPVGDFLGEGMLPSWRPEAGCDWVVVNPPFNKAEAFVLRGLALARIGVAALVRLGFLETTGRHRRLFQRYRPSWIFQFAERVVMSEGRLLDPSQAYWFEHKQKWAKPSTATAYCWLVWHRQAPAATRFDWIAPCRARLERDGDYPPLVHPQPEKGT